MPVAHTWRGYSTAIFIELGQLNQNEGKNPVGEATAMLEWDWRVEKRKSIYFGSGSYARKIRNGLRALVGRTVEDVYTEGRLPELVLCLSGGIWIHTFAIYERHPQWTLFLPDKNCLSSKSGLIEIKRCNGQETELNSESVEQPNKLVGRTRIMTSHVD
jgi:hypothetical protein